MSGGGGGPLDSYGVSLSVELLRAPIKCYEMLRSFVQALQDWLPQPRRGAVD